MKKIIMDRYENEKSNNPLEGSSDTGQQDNANSSAVDQKIAVNPNPRANENIKQAPFDKTSEDNNEEERGSVGTEITDGEAG